MLFAAIYLANAVNAWQLCQYLWLFMPVCDDKWACCVFIYKWNYEKDSFLKETLGYNINNY